MAISIKITKSTQSKIHSLDFETLQFGKNFSDHMFRADYIDGTWQNPQILPYSDILLPPSLSAIHYGQSIFEGMKAYKSPEGTPQLFRPLMNFKRMNLSAQRMAMPEIPEEIFMEGLKKLVMLDKDWIPAKEGSSMYLRPFMFATDDFIGVRPSKNFAFMIICSPANAYYSKPINVLVEEKYVRAAQGGVGFAKAAGNYGASMLPTREANQKGFDQYNCTDCRDHQYVEESGTMNVFFVANKTVLTPEIDGTILQGVTRDSCIQILRDKGYKVEERKISIKEIAEAFDKGLLQDAFGTGTAAMLARIASFNYKGKDYVLPPVESREVSNLLYDTLNGIYSSRIPDKFGWIMKLEEELVVTH
ncbi:MAG: branched-chain amino acid aminotransferase [Bacteroidia bacterium]